MIGDNTFFDNKGSNITCITPTGMRIITDYRYDYTIIYWKGTICIKYKENELIDIKELYTFILLYEYLLLRNS
jgi:hypothetical protein